MTHTTENDTQAAGTPRWVKVFGIIALVVVVLVVVIVVTGRGGPHSPRRHAPFGDAGALPASVPEGHTPPSGAYTQG